MNELKSKITKGTNYSKRTEWEDMPPRLRQIVMRAIDKNVSRYANIYAMRKSAYNIASLTKNKSGFFGIAFGDLLPVLDHLAAIGYEGDGWYTFVDHNKYEIWTIWTIINKEVSYE